MHTEAIAIRFANSFPPNQYAIPVLTIVLLTTARVIAVTATDTVISCDEDSVTIDMVIASTSVSPAIMLEI